MKVIETYSLNFKLFCAHTKLHSNAMNMFVDDVLKSFANLGIMTSAKMICFNDALDACDVSDMHNDRYCLCISNTPFGDIALEKNDINVKYKISYE